MSFTPEKRKFLAELIGEEKVAALEGGTADAKAILDAIGVESKEQKPDAPVETKAVPAFLKKPAAKKPEADDEEKPAEDAEADAPMMETEGEPPADEAEAADEPDAEPEGEAEAADAEDAGDAVQAEVTARAENDALQKTVAALTEQVGMMTDKMSAMLSMMESQASKIKSLEASDDAKVAALIRPRATPAAASKGYRASAAPETVLTDGSPVDAELKKSGPSAEAEFWANTVLAPVMHKQ